MIELRNISVRYRGRGQEVHAVKDVSLSIGDAEIYGIVGASGAGKSSLLRTINLLERPDAGAVIIGGEDISTLTGAALRQRRQRIGMVFQHFNLMHTATVYENAAFALRVAGKSEAEIRQRVPEILELVGLADKADAYPVQLSGGQKQRVGIARAIANRPEVLLCDEPTSALDLETASAILDLLREINQRFGITIVLISHEMAVIKKICTRVAVMEGGLVVEEGDVFDIFATPTHPFTRQLVEHTLNLDLPQRLTENLAGTLLRILFLGDRAETPIISETAQRFGVSINILHGKIEYINNRALGLLVALLTEIPPTHAHTVSGAENQVSRAVEFICQNTARVEVLHG